MVRKKIVRAKARVADLGASITYEVELELHPSAFAVPAPVNHPEPAPPPNGDRCACNHSIAVEHNDMGCLQGCPTEQCARTEVP